MQNKLQSAVIAAMLMLGAGHCQAQHTGLNMMDTSALAFTVGPWAIGISDSTNSFTITRWSDGRIEVKGDTLKGVAYLWKKWDESENEQYELWRFINSAVDFTNGVPDYWKDGKNNKAWPKYRAALRRQGYTFGRRR